MAVRQCVTEGALRVKSCSLFAFADKDPGSFCGGNPRAAGRVTAREREFSRLGVSPGRGLRQALWAT